MTFDERSAQYKALEVPCDAIGSKLIAASPIANQLSPETFDKMEELASEKIILLGESSTRNFFKKLVCFKKSNQQP